MNYFLIYQHDKEARVRPVTKKALEQMLKEEEPTFIKEIDETDPAYWGDNAYLLIKGEIIVPKPKKVVTEFEID